MSEDIKNKNLPIGALVLIFLGVVFLLNNFGLIPWSSWNFLWKLWPLILIFMGLEVVFGSSHLGNTLLFVLVLGILIYILLNLTGNIHGNVFRIPVSTPEPTLMPRMYRFNY